MDKPISQRLRDLAKSDMLSQAVQSLLVEAAEALEAKLVRPAVFGDTRVAVRSGLRDGEEIIWPIGVEERYKISSPTRWRWERSGKLPPRDVRLGADKSGWRKATLDSWESVRQ